jgi:prepilin-type N-terminal cleavage/methylation domain-containing protein
MIHFVAADPRRRLHRGGEGRSARSRGFTLMEVLLATVLMALVLSTLWGVFHVYSRLFESGGIEARNARLVTALERQFTDDFHSAIEDSRRENEAATSSSAGNPGVVRRFGLQGTASTLRFDVLQTGPEDQLSSAEDALSLGRASPSKPQVPELKTIVYRFTPDRRPLSKSAREDAAESGQGLLADVSLPGPGLSRWEIGFETPLENTEARTPATKTPAGEVDVRPPSRDAASGVSFEDLAAQTIATQAITWLPEVHRAAFRYFDGRTWSDSWDSLQRGSLPVAVEVKVSLRNAAETDSRRRSKKKAEPAAEATDDSSEATLDAEDQPALASDEDGFSTETRRPACRFLIRLPIAQHRPEIKPAGAAPAGSDASAEANPPVVPPADQLPRVEVPSYVPPPWSSGGQAAQNPDSPTNQWLRTVP